jgi:hypothetical protein
VQKHSHAVDVRIGVKVIDAGSVERAGAPNDSVDFVTFLKQKIGKITSVLASDSGNESFFHSMSLG